jgi:SAM-dependent methyltransferase
MDAKSREIGEGYDALAEKYAEALFDELRDKPLDRALLACFAEEVKKSDAGSVLELGCGPGQVARHLHALGVPMVGVDASHAMIAIARKRSPSIDFRRGDMLALDDAEGTYAGVIAFYAIVHLAPEELVIAFREMHRVLRRGGLLLVSFHLAGESAERVRPGELWGTKTDLEWVLFPRATVEDAMRAAGFTIESSTERAPYEGKEHPSRRAYLVARKTA